MQSSHPFLFQLTFDIDGLATPCGIVRSSEDGEDRYSVCANVNGMEREFVMLYNQDAKRFFFDGDGIPDGLRSAEVQITKAIHAQAKTDLIHFMSMHPRDAGTDDA